MLRPCTEEVDSGHEDGYQQDSAYDIQRNLSRVKSLYSVNTHARAAMNATGTFALNLVHCTEAIAFPGIRTDWPTFPYHEKHYRNTPKQIFINQKRLDGKKQQTLKNLKWGLSSIFESAIHFGYLSVNPASRANLPPKEVKEKVKLPTPVDLVRLIEELPEPYSTMVYLVSVSSIRPEELAFRWSDLEPEVCNLNIVRAMNKGQFHTPKYQEGHRIIRLTDADVDRLLSLKRKVNAKDDDWMFPNRIKKGGQKLKPGPIWHEHILARHIQPVADRLGLPHITWRLLRHWGATHLVGGGVDPKVVQQRLGHSRVSTTLDLYTHVLDPRANDAAEMISGHLGYEIPAEFSVNPVEV